MVNISEIKEFSRKLRLLYLENIEAQRNIDAALVYLDLAVHAAEQSFTPDAATVAPCRHKFDDSLYCSFCGEAQF